MENKKSAFCSLILTFLCRAIAELNEKDSLIRAEFAELPNDYKVNIGILPYGNYIGIIKTQAGLKVKKNGFATADLNVYFKSVPAAKNVMLAKQNLAQSYSQHALIVGGDIAIAMGLVRAINRVECYLFPRFMTKKILPKIKKETCTLGVYCKILFCANKYKYKI